MGGLKNEVKQKIIDLKEKDTTLLSTIWEGNRYIQRRMRNIQKLFVRPEILKVFDDTIPADNLLHSFTVASYKKLLKNKKIDIYKKPFFSLRSELSDLQDYFGIEVSIRKLDAGKYEFKPHCHDPKYLSFKIKGNILDELNSSRKKSEYFNRAAESECLINEIEIDDVTSRPDNEKGHRSQLCDVLSELKNRISPTVIKYKFHDAFKRFLVYIPSGLNTSTFFDQYRKKITKMHNDFYQKEYRGRPKSRLNQKREIRKILREIKEKRNISSISIDDLCSEVAEKLCMSPGTIRRHYRQVIREIRNKKDKN